MGALMGRRGAAGCRAQRPAAGGNASGLGEEGRGGARAGAGRLPGAFRGRERASLAAAAAAAARTALRPPRRRSRGRPVLWRQLCRRHQNPKGSSPYEDQ
ncbi:hypothetical protein GHT09_011760 [Marmota monax]|uniref:Uncharacterized protein n=1 Tax=Marmota monax TaxID=9995 RepID=A0A834UYJ3_MARMO|nr:hypothetical protein GHT09_011760 [Marmota monax]